MVSLKSNCVSFRPSGTHCGSQLCLTYSSAMLWYIHTCRVRVHDRSRDCTRWVLWHYAKLFILTGMRQERRPRLGKLDCEPIRDIRIFRVIFNIKFSGVVKAFTGPVLNIHILIIWDIPRSLLSAEALARLIRVLTWTCLNWLLGNIAPLMLALAQLAVKVNKTK